MTDSNALESARRCAHCGGSMEGKKASALSCSVACNQARLATRRKAEKWAGVSADRKCGQCEGGMEGKRPHAVYCSKACKHRASETRAQADGRRRAADRARYAREAEHRRAYARQYLKDNPERMRAIRRRRKGQLRAEALLFTERDWARLVARYRGCCAYCGTQRDDLQREHIIPLARGGRHSVGNIVPACPPCNARKKTKLLIEFRRDLKKGGDRHHYSPHAA